jgi:cell division septum initiation protein DivIVA
MAMFRRAPAAGDDEGRAGIDDLLDSDTWDAVSATWSDAGTATDESAEDATVEIVEQPVRETAEPAAARPVFRTRFRGYDRLQVDNFVARSEWEILSARRHADHLLDRFGACAAELELSRRLLAQTPKGRELSPVPERVGEILRLAADEATQMIDAAGAEAGQVLAEARAEADARLRKAHAIKEIAVSAADELREQARRDRDEAADLLERARIEADDLVSGAEADRDRLAAEARAAEQRTAAAAQELAVLREELADLRRQRDEARSSLRLLTDQIGKVLQAADPAKLVSAH